MAQIKTVTTTSGENTITFDSFYPFVWIRNAGDNDITAANYSGAQAGDENTVSIKAGEVAMIQAETENIYIIGATTCEIHAQGFAECPFKRGLGGGEQISVESLSVTTNGTYTAPTGTAYSPVTVDVQEQPWEPLEDGYSNFWFELTDDTLSPWLNFSAKNADAVIDWGDGSGEIALDTLTPTHTYAKAGKYVVKCKGVTGIGQQNVTPNSGVYLSILKAAEFNNDVTALATGAFSCCFGLEYIELGGITTIGTAAVHNTVSLKRINIPNTTTTILQNAFQGCVQLLDAALPSNNSYTKINTALFRDCTSLTTVAIPSNITTIGTTAFYACSSITSINLPQYISSIEYNAFNYCSSLTEVHIAATNPPTLGSAVFNNMPSNWICYVPQGTGDTYKAAAGWSAYADHILEEGEVVTRAMKAKFAKEAKALEDTGDMR